MGKSGGEDFVNRVLDTQMSGEHERAKLFSKTAVFHSLALAGHKTEQDRHQEIVREKG